MATEWYFQSDGQECGPFTGSQLKRYADDGRIRPESLVKYGGDGRWVPAAQVQGLFAAAQPVTAVALPPVIRGPAVRPTPHTQAASQPENPLADFAPDIEAASVEPSFPDLYDAPSTARGRPSRSYSRSKKKQQSSKMVVNWGLGALTLVVALFSLAASQGLFTDKQRAIEAEAVRVNKTLPKQIDEITRMDRMEVGPNRTVTLVFTLSKELSADEKKALRETVTLLVRSQPFIAQIRQDGVSLRVRYRNSAGKTILEFAVSG